MNETLPIQRVPMEMYTDGLKLSEGDRVHVEVERDDIDSVSLHTFYEGEGSIFTFQMTTQQATELAFQLLKEARPR